MINRLLLSISMSSVVLLTGVTNTILAASAATPANAVLYGTCDPVNNPRSCPSNLDNHQIT